MSFGLLDVLICNAGELVTFTGPQPRRGREMSSPTMIPNGAVAIRQGRIVDVGPTSELKRYRARKTIDARHRLITPGLVDAHTHLIFSGSREDEFEMRIRGASYMEIAKAGGGILSTVDRVRAASRDALVREAVPRAQAMLRHGTTTAEAKSGYGLATEHELKSLEAIPRIARRTGLALVPTFLGAHEVPREYAGKQGDYVEILVREMIPAVAQKKLARFCDVFCEEGVFTVEEARHILTAARQAGMIPKLHADEFKASGATELGAELGAASCDHLMAISDKGIRRLKTSQTMAVLLPATSFFLGLGRYAPARRLIEEGVPIALGTDFNPGSSMTLNMQLILTLACTQLRLTPAEALCAATINAAHAIGEGTRVGTLEKGKAADLVVWDVPNHRSLAYEFGTNRVHLVMKAGRVLSL